MKIYYYFSSMDHCFTDISIKLKQLNPSIECAGLANGRRDFFNRFPYKKLSFSSDILKMKVPVQIDEEFLTEIENEYGFTISSCLHADRFLIEQPKERRLFIAQEIIKLLLNDLQDFKPTTIILEGIDDFISLFLYYYGRSKNIRFYYFVYARLGPYLSKSNRLDTGRIDFEHIFEAAKKEGKVNPEILYETKIFLEDYVKNRKQPSYVTRKSMRFKMVGFEDIKRTFKSIRLYYQDQSPYSNFPHPFTFPILRLRRIYRNRRYQTLLRNHGVSLDFLSRKKFFIYPLHLHPEASTLVQGRWLNNQIRIIEMFSKALPSDVLLIVKEHKVSLGRRPAKFYQEINNFHNAFFVSENTDVYELLDKSLGVITISSSMGLEALMTGKPIITVGDIFYNFSSNTYSATDFSNLESIIQKAINHEFDYYDILCLLSTHRQGLVEVSSTFSPYNYDDFSVRQLANSIMLDCHADVVLEN